MFVGEIVLAVGMAFVNGADSALATESLQALGRSERFQTFEARSQSLSFASAAITGLVGSALAAEFGLRATMWAQTVVTLPLVWLAWQLTETPHVASSESADTKADPATSVSAAGPEALTEEALARPSTRKVLGQALADTEIRWLIIYGATMGTATYTMVWITQPFYQALGIPLALVGLAGALQIGIQFPLGHLTDWYEAKLGRRATLTSFVGLAVVSYVAMAYGLAVKPVWWVALALIGLSFIRAVFTPVARTYLNRRLNRDNRATVLSLQSLTMRSFTIGLGPLIGWSYDHWSLDTALWLSAALYGGLGSLALWRMWVHRLL